MTYQDNTTDGKVNILLLSEYNKITLSQEIGISRPTLDTRLLKLNWKKSEVEMVNKLYKKFKDAAVIR